MAKFMPVIDQERLLVLPSDKVYRQMNGERSRPNTAFRPKEGYDPAKVLMHQRVSDMPVLKTQKGSSEIFDIYWFV
jgi:hypothetical protein